MGSVVENHLFEIALEDTVTKILLERLRHQSLQAIYSPSKWEVIEAATSNISFNVLKEC